MKIELQRHLFTADKSRREVDVNVSIDFGKLQKWSGTALPNLVSVSWVEGGCKWTKHNKLNAMYVLNMVTMFFLGFFPFACFFLS